MNSVFIATSLDGFIADKMGNIEWLNSIPNPDQIDMGYLDFIRKVDAIIMGRTTFETVCNFGIDWPYNKPVFVLSNTLSAIPRKFQKNEINIINGELKDIVSNLNNKGYNHLYIDGGKTIQNFLQVDLIDELTITVIPTLLGEGIPLFNELPQQLMFKCVKTKIYLDSIVQNTFKRYKE